MLKNLQRYGQEDKDVTKDWPKVNNLFIAINSFLIDAGSNCHLVQV